MEKSYFKCYELFHKIGKELPQELQAKYYVALMDYGLYGDLPTDPVIKALLQGPMYSIDKSDEDREKKSEYMSGNQNAVKNREKVSKQTKTDKNRDGQNKTEKNTGRRKKNIEEYEVIEDKEENIKKEKINKKKILDFVLLSDEEYEKLNSQLGEKITRELIEKLNNYIGSTGKRYKSHYFTLLNRSKKENIAPNLSFNREIQKHREQIKEQILNSNPDSNGEVKNQTDNRRTNIIRD